MAVWSPSGASRNAPAGDLGAAFYRAVFQEGCATLGLAILQARRAMQGDFFTRDTFAVYNLLGDPALRIAGNRAGQSQEASFAQWRWQRFAPAELADPAISGATPDNLRKYAWNGPGLVWIESAESETSPGADGFIVNWERRIQRRDLEYRLFLSEDLETWEEPVEELHELGATPALDPGMETVRTRILRPGARWLFLGIQVRLK